MKKLYTTKWFLDNLDKVRKNKDKEGFKALMSDFNKAWKLDSVNASKVQRKFGEVESSLRIPDPELKELMSEKAKKKYKEV